MAPGLEAHLFVVVDKHSRGFAARRDVSFRLGAETR